MEVVREWLQQMVCYLCLMTLLLHVIPDNVLKKYVHFFLGILLILIVLKPLGSIFGGGRFFHTLESESIKGLKKVYASGEKSWEEVVSEKTQEEYQRELQQKIEGIYKEYDLMGDGNENGETTHDQ